MTMIWIALYAQRGMLVLRPCPRSRPVVNFYLLASAAAILAAILAIATALTPLKHLLGINVFLACAGTVFVALGAGYSWMRKTQWFTGR